MLLSQCRPAIPERKKRMMNIKGEARAENEEGCAFQKPLFL